MTALQMVKANGVGLCVQTFGDGGDPALLLIAGAANSMDWWQDGLCERLADGGCFVIRYDHRDTGQSATYPPGAPGYDGRDLSEDALRVLDALGVSSAHMAGMSMGGGIAQELALLYPDRVASLTLISSSPAVARETGAPELPPPSDEMRQRFAEPLPQPDWSDRAAVVDYLIEDWRPYYGSEGFDETALRELAARVVERTTNIASSMTNHWVMEHGEPVQGRLGEIQRPALVVHGTDDPLFPFAHGEALAAEIPGARLLPLAGFGHEYPPPATWDRVVPAILRLATAR
jgi:pimeloyl-ACP methyl ester carboxylesterase